MTSIVFFDLETRKHAEDLNPEDRDAGWDALRKGKGGISALALYDTRDNWLYLYDDFTVHDAARRLESADLVVGFCSAKFDVPVIEGLVGRALRLRYHYDIYVELSREIAQRGIRTGVGDLKLDTISRRNLGRGKIDHGSHAKELARCGRWGQLFNYCADDVHLTRDLFVKLCRDSGLSFNKGKFIPLPVPELGRDVFRKE